MFSVVNRLFYIAIDLCAYAKHYKAVHVQDGECGASPTKPDFPSKLRCLFEQQALYNLCRSHKYLSVSPGGVCITNSRTTTYRLRFKFYLTCCVLVSPRTNVDYFIYIKNSIHHSAYIDHVLHHVRGPCLHQ